MKDKDSDGRYAEWRKTIPFTDEQIATQLEADAALFAKDGNDFMARKYLWRAGRVREGFVCTFDVHRVWSSLIKTCAICGKKALYRAGSSGRCSTHRLVKDSFALRRKLRLDRAAGEQSEIDRQFDRLSAARERFHAMANAREKR